MTCRLIAIGTVTGNCRVWIQGFEIDLGDISAEANIPSQSVRNSPSTGCPSGYPLSRQGVQMNGLSGYANNTYELVTWQSVPNLIKRGDTCIIKTRYDCINGACLQSTTYKTPGIYNSLQECEQGCSVNSDGCPEGYECVSIESTQQLKDCICS